MIARNLIYSAILCIPAVNYLNTTDIGSTIALTAGLVTLAMCMEIVFKVSRNVEKEYEEMRNDNDNDGYDYSNVRWLMKNE